MIPKIFGSYREGIIVIPNYGGFRVKVTRSHQDFSLFLIFKQLISVCIHQLTKKDMVNPSSLGQYFIFFGLFGGLIWPWTMKVTEPYCQGHWNIKVTSTESPCTTSLCIQMSQTGSLHRMSARCYSCHARRLSIQNNISLLPFVWWTKLPHTTHLVSYSADINLFKLELVFIKHYAPTACP